MSKTPKPIIHGRDHEHGGADPIGTTYETTGTAGAGVVVAYSMSGDLVVETGELRWYAPAAGTIVEVHASVGHPSSGSGVTVQVNKNGTSLGTVTIAAAADFNTFVPSSPDFAAGDYFTVDVTAIGSTSPGRNLVVQLR